MCGNQINNSYNGNTIVCSALILIEEQVQYFLHLKYKNNCIDYKNPNLICQEEAHFLLTKNVPLW